MLRWKNLFQWECTRKFAGGSVGPAKCKCECCLVGETKVGAQKVTKVGGWWVVLIGTRWVVKPGRVGSVGSSCWVVGRRV